MTKLRMMRVMTILCSGALVLQGGACDTVNTLNDYVQTVLLGISAAGAIAILQNI
jgi:hypothetical protein